MSHKYNILCDSHVLYIWGVINYFVRKYDLYIEKHKTCMIIIYLVEVIPHCRQFGRRLQRTMTNAARNNKLLRRYNRSHRLLAALLRPCSKLFMLKLSGWLLIKLSLHRWFLFGYSPEDMVTSNTVWSCNKFLICAQKMQPWLPLPINKTCYHENTTSFGTFITYKYISTQVLSLFIFSLSIIIF